VTSGTVAPAHQVNWWLPVFPVRETNAMSFDLASFAHAVPNTSGDFDYYENNARRFSTAKSVGKEGQARPAAIDHTPGVDLIPLPAPGEVLLFSGAQLHPVPSRTPPGWPGTASTSAPWTPET